MLGLREVRSALKTYNIRHSRRLGQNFLVDQNIRDKIIDAAGVSRKDDILEIGPGLGALTSELSKRAKKVTAIEKDKRLYSYLLENNSSPNLELIQGDILKHNLKTSRRIKVIGNLPYYISSPVITYLINNRPSIDSVFISVQKEFGRRLIAEPGDREYGAISCFVQFYTGPVILFNITKNAFYPVPKVDSSFLKLTVKSKISNRVYLTDEEKLFRIIRRCFEERRKTVLNSLYPLSGVSSKAELSNRLKKAGISPARRPETMSLEDFMTTCRVMP